MTDARKEEIRKWIEAYESYSDERGWAAGAMSLLVAEIERLKKVIDAVVENGNQIYFMWNPQGYWARERVDAEGVLLGPFPTKCEAALAVLEGNDD